MQYFNVFSFGLLVVRGMFMDGVLGVTTSELPSLHESVLEILLSGFLGRK